MTEFQVRKSNLADNRIVDTGTALPLADGQVRVRIDRFAFTANNITYAATGDRIGYWQFFPAGGDDADDRGIIPVWGFAEVIESRLAEVPVGDRLFGYFPPAATLDMTPTRISATRFIEGAPHRAELPPAYNSYTRVNAEPGYDSATDNARMLLWPLYITSFCLWDSLQDNAWCGAKQIVIVSASSKTSIGLAYALNDDATAPPAIGVTSARNLQFVDKLGLYERAVTYETLTDIDATLPTVIVDMSGSRDVLGRLHAHLGDNMTRCLNVGLTHWDDKKTGDSVITERSEFFFAPAHIQKRVHDWGADGFAQKSSGFMQRTAEKSGEWLTFRTIDGLPGLAEIYDDVCKGQVPADHGLIVEL